MARFAQRGPARGRALSLDRRRLGVAVKRIVLAEADLRLEIGYGHPSLREGFHYYESGYRWTNGMARLPDELLRSFVDDVTVEVHLIRADLRYPLAVPAPEAAPARIRRPKANIAGPMASSTRRSGSSPI